MISDRLYKIIIDGGGSSGWSSGGGGGCKTLGSIYRKFLINFIHFLQTEGVHRDGQNQFLPDGHQVEEVQEDVSFVTAIIEQ